MTIDPTTLPDGTVVQCEPSEMGPHLIHVGCLKPTRVFVPVPEGMTSADIEAALADAGAWVEVATLAYLPKGARVRREWRNREGGRYYVHRDDLPPTGPDAELVEKMARGIRAAKGYEDPWDNVVEDLRENYRVSARAALAVVREHEAKS